jgi:hypothetical protein
MRLRTLTLILGATLVLGACVHSGPSTASCGDSNRRKPIVCVDDSVVPLTLDPEPVYAHEKTQFLGSPVLMQWRTASGEGNLQVKFKEEGCVRDVTCDGSGKCKAKTVRLPAGADTKQCKYDVWIVGKTEPLDPNVIIVKCCATQ